MRIIKILFLSILFFFFVSFLGIVIFLKVYDMNHLKPQIIEAINDSTGLNVGVGKVEFNFSFLEGATLDLKKVFVKDHPSFSKDNFFEAEAISFHVNIFSFFLRREIVSSQMKFLAPKIILSVDNSGVSNIEKLFGQINKATSEDRLANEDQAGLQEKIQLASAEKTEIKATYKNQKNILNDQPAPLLKILVNSFQVREGIVHFINKNIHSHISIPVKDINFDIFNFSFDQPFKFNGHCSLWSHSPNIKVQGSAIVNQYNKQIRFDDVLLSSDLSLLLFDDIRKNIPAPQLDYLKGCKDGKMSFLINQLIVGEQGLVLLSSEADISDLRFDFVNNKYPINNLNMKFEVTEEKILLKNILMKLASGEIQLKGHINKYLKEQEYLLGVHVKAIELSELLAFEDIGYDIEGFLNGNFQLQGEFLDFNKMRENLSGEGGFDVREGKIKDLNFLRLVLERIPNIADLNKKIQENLPERIKEKLQEQDTDFNKIYFELLVSKGELFFKNTEINTAEFSVRLNGKMDLYNQISLKSDFFISEDLSKNLAEAVKELSCLFDSHNQIYINLKEYSGPLSKISIYPEPNDLISRMGKCQLRDVLQKTIKKHITTEGSSSSDSVLIPTFEGDENPADAIIDKALDVFNDLF